MSVERLERILWRLRQMRPKCDEFTNYELRRAVIMECGAHPTTYKNNRKALTVLKWIITKDKGKRVILTNNDLTGDV